MMRKLAAHYIRGSSGATLTTDLVKDIHLRIAGNPLFVKKAMKLLLDEEDSESERSVAVGYGRVSQLARRKGKRCGASSRGRE